MPKLVIQYPPFFCKLHFTCSYRNLGLVFTKTPRLSSHSLQNDMDLLQLTKTISRLQKWQSKQLLFCNVLFQIVKQMQKIPTENQIEPEGEFGWPQNFSYTVFVMFWPWHTGDTTKGLATVLSNKFISSEETWW